MGIYDRDYMRRPPDRSISLPPFSVAVALLILFVGSAILLSSREEKAKAPTRRAASLPTSGQAVSLASPTEPEIPLDINSASLKELQFIPNIGPVRAQSIIDHRPYTSIDDLAEKGALGSKLVERIRQFVKVEGPPSKSMPSPH